MAAPIREQQMRWNRGDVLTRGPVGKIAGAMGLPVWYSSIAATDQCGQLPAIEVLSVSLKLETTDPTQTACPLVSADFDIDHEVGCTGESGRCL